MLKDKNMQLITYSILYNKISRNHMLKRVNNAVDASKNRCLSRSL